MRILIIEDEQNSAERLKRLVTEIDSHHEIVEIPKSNAEVRAFFAASAAVDLILADIQYMHSAGPAAMIFLRVFLTGRTIHLMLLSKQPIRTGARTRCSSE